MPPDTPSQSSNGSAFEWAVAKAMSNVYYCDIVLDQAALNAKSKSNNLKDSKQKKQYMKAALKAIKKIQKIEEPKIRKLSSYKGLAVSLQPPQNGMLQNGSDVRDVLLLENSRVLFGVSCKTNHYAFKHSRMSQNIDFVKQWGLAPDGASEVFKEENTRIFKILSEHKNQGLVKFSEIENLNAEVIDPLLSAFVKELQRLNSLDSASVSQGLFSYLVGFKDFYKVVNHSSTKQVSLYGFNMGQTLSVKKTSKPSSILYVDNLTPGLNSRAIRFDNGFAFNLRLHSASTNIETSLKFDITAISLPATGLYQEHLSY